ARGSSDGGGSSAICAAAAASITGSSGSMSGVIGTLSAARRGPALRACHAPCATTPASTRPPSEARAIVKLLIEPVRSRRFSQADGRFHVDGDDARDALLLHRHADQLLGHLHRDLVVADEEELRALGHLFDQLGIALGVR